jgi:hypothetical protein
VISARPKPGAFGNFARCATALLIVTSPLIVPATSAGADNSASTVTITGTFKPSLVRPGWNAASSGPYAGSLGVLFDSSSKSVLTLDSGSPAYVAAYDSTTFKPRANSARLLDGTITAVLSDPRLPGVAVAVGSGQKSATTAIEHLEVRNGRVVVTKRIPITTQQTVVGLAYDPMTHDFFALLATYAPTNFITGEVPGSVELSFIDQSSAKVVWTQALPNCNLPMQFTLHALPPAGLSAPIGVVRSPHVVDIGCSAQGTESTNLGKFPIPVGVGIVTLNGTGAGTTYSGFDLDPYPGDLTSAPSGLWFPTAERMAVQVTNVVNVGGWALFDGRHSNYVGIVPMPQQAQLAGTDALHSRLYLVSEVHTTGLVATDVQVTPADQGHNYPKFAADPTERTGGQGRVPANGSVATDPSTGRLLLLYQGSDTFVVAHDNFPYYAPPAPPNVDRNTAGIPEVDGKTAANYSGSAQGYGSVIRQVGGEAALQYNTVPIGNGDQLKGTRQFATSYLDQLALTNASAQVTAITGVVDQGNTQGQLSQGGVSWPYAPVACVDFGSGHKTASADGGTATCDAASALATGSIVGSSSSAAVPGQPTPDVIAIGGTSLSTSTAAQHGKGMTTSVRSTASGISVLGGVLRIGKVMVESTAHANGQAGGATAKFDRSVQYVSLNGTELCTTGCDIHSVEKTVNAQLSGHARITFPEPDPTELHSPGGYQAVIRRDPFAQAEETTLNDQPGTRGEIPGMVITIFEDNSESSRTIVYLAGTEADAHYGVYSLGGDCASCPPPVNHPVPAPGNSGGGNPGIPGGSATQPTSPSGGQPPVVASGTNVGGFIKHGWELLIAGLGQALRTFGVWLVLLLPVYLSARRWALANRH